MFIFFKCLSPLDLSCPPNMEYHLCSSHMSVCAANPSPLAARCTEGCFCKPGFFHSGGECVPNSDCGCIYDGVYHTIHESFHPDEHCHLKCVCVGHNQVQCTNHTCPPATRCSIKSGYRACYALETVECTALGGRHLQTYDGRSLNFSLGSCRYVLSQICDQSDSIVVQQGQLDIRVHGVNVSLSMEHFGKVKVRIH